MANQWFRMYSDFLNDPKMISLAFEDQRHFIGILALKSDGTLDQQCDEKLRDRIIAQRLWIDYAILSDVKKRLVNAGLISESWQPLAWEKRQFVSDNSSERVRRFREKKASVTGNVSETLQKRPQNRTDTDTEERVEAEDRNTGVLPFPSLDKKKKATPAPKDFEVTVEMFDWAVEQGVPETRVRPETEAFIDRNKAKGETYVDWNSAWKNWMRNAVKFSGAACR